LGPSCYLVAYTHAINDSPVLALTPPSLPHSSLTSASSKLGSSLNCYGWTPSRLSYPYSDYNLSSISTLCSGITPNHSSSKRFIIKCSTPCSSLLFEISNIYIFFNPFKITNSILPLYIPLFTLSIILFSNSIKNCSEVMFNFDYLVKNYFCPTFKFENYFF
jgi:hypothetical protein